MLVNLIDRILLLAAVLLSTQLPHFVDQYTQRIGGHYETEQAYLERFQDIADEFFRGDLSLMVQEFKASQQGSIVRMGELIEGSLERTAALKQALAILRGDDFLQKLGHLATTPDRTVVEGTLGDFQPGMPFSQEALLCGASGGILSLLLFGASVRLPLLVLRRRKKRALPA
jgi:hypothetical protein